MADIQVCGVGSAFQAASVCGGDARALYAASTYNDFALWAAAWAFKATGNLSALADAQAFQQSFLQNEAAAGLL